MVGKRRAVMPVSIVRTAQEQLVSARVIEALREGI
jgi:hypothetical protein